MFNSGTVVTFVQQRIHHIIYIYIYIFNSGSVLVTFVCAIGTIPKAIIPEVVAHASSPKPLRKGFFFRAKNTSKNKTKERKKNRKPPLLFFCPAIFFRHHLIFCMKLSLHDPKDVTVNDVHDLRQKMAHMPIPSLHTLSP